MENRLHFVQLVGTHVNRDFSYLTSLHRTNSFMLCLFLYPPMVLDYDKEGMRE
jgi:hypothetical protein